MKNGSDCENLINEEELDWDGDISVLKGTPYTGKAYMSFPNGAVKREVLFKEGFEEGLCREWHKNGNLRREWIAQRGVPIGKVTEWHENGVVKSVGEYEFGAELKYEEWDESGELVQSRQIDEASELFKYVEQMRAAK